MGGISVLILISFLSAIFYFFVAIFLIIIAYLLFIYIFESLALMRIYKNADNSKYYKEIYSLDINLDILNSIKDEVDYECFSSFVEPFIMNDKMYISWYVWDISVSRSAVIYIDYDFNKKEIKDYKLLEE